MGFRSGLRTGFVVWARTDMTDSEGGRRKGEDETVVVIHDRRTFVSGSTASGEGVLGISLG